MTLLADANSPGSQEDVGARSPFGGGCWSLGLRLEQPLTFGSDYHMPAPLPLAGEELVRSQPALLWYSLNLLFCEWARL